MTIPNLPKASRMNWWVVFRNALAKPVKLSKMPVKEASSAAVN